MRYSPTHKDETKNRLIDASRALAKHAGFAATGVDTLAAASGLTGGAFYRHFDSKAELFAAIIEREMEQSTSMLGGDAEASSEELRRLLRGYLSSYHALHPQAGCAIPALGAEIARADPAVRKQVEQSLKAMHGCWAGRLGGDGDQAWTILAQCVGALLLARSVESDQTRKEILSSTRRALDEYLQPGGKP